MPNVEDHHEAQASLRDSCPVFFPEGIAYAQGCGTPICTPGNQPPVVWVATDNSSTPDSVKLWLTLAEVDAEQNLLLDSLQVRRNGTNILSGITWGSYVVDVTEDNLAAWAMIAIDTGWTVFTVRGCDSSLPTAYCAEQKDSVYRAPPPPTPPSQAAPTVVLLQRPDARALSSCGACTIVSHTYSTPSYVSLDEPRSLSLSYSSATANPVGLVALEATTWSSQVPLRLSIQLRRLDTGALLTLTNGATKAFYLGDTGTVALAAQFDASAFSSGTYPFEVVVETHWSSGTAVLADTVFTQLLILNESASRYGAGWSLSVPKLFEMPDSSVMMFDGGESLLHFSLGSCSGSNCSYTSPAGVFSLLTKHAPVSGYGGTTWSLVSRTLDSSAFYPDGRFRHVRDRFGNRTLVEYDTVAGLLLPTQVKDPVDKITTLTYASDTSGGRKMGSLRRFTLPDGRIIRTKVSNAAGDLVEIRDPRADSALAFAAGYSNHRMVRSRERMPSYDSLSFDAFGYVTHLRSPVVATTSGNTRIVTQFQALESRLLLANGIGVSLSDSTRAGLRLDSAFALATGPTGAMTRTWRDVTGGPRKQVSLSSSSAAHSTEWTYNAASQLTAVFSPGEADLRYYWDNSRLLVTTDRIVGRYVEATYDTLDLIATLKVNGQLQVTNFFSGNRFNPDSSRSDSASTTRYYYDSRGRVLQVVDPQGNATTFAYDTLGMRNLWRVVQPGSATTTFAFDSAGRTRSTTTPRGFQYISEFDHLNRDTLQLQPGSIPTRVAYTDSIGLRVVTDARSNQYRDSVNAVGWLLRSRDPRGKVETYSYNAAGLLAEVLNRRNETIAMVYDSLGRMTRRVAGADTTWYSFAADRSWASARNAESTDTIKFQSGRRVGEITLRDTFQFSVISFRYAFGLPSGVAVARLGPLGVVWGVTTGTGYDPVYRVNYLRDYGDHETAITHDVRGLPNGIAYPTSATFSSRLKRAMLYDSREQMNADWFSNSAVNVIHGREYQRSATGEIERASHVGASFPVYDEFVYDSLSRLNARRTMQDWENIEWVPWDPWGDCPGCMIPVETSGTDTTDVRSFTYDRIGTRTDHGAVIDSVGNRVTSFDGYTILYDSAGFVVSKSKSGDSRTYSWNALGQLTQVVANGTTTTYGYDGFGRRVRRTVAGSTIRYLYNGGDLVAEVDVSGAAVAQYTYHGLDAPHSMRRAGKLYYYLQDGIGNVRALVDTTGAVVATYSYSPYGEIESSTGSLENPLRFKGREWDAIAGLYFMRARYYDPQMGRFLSPDPLGIDGGINLYGFAESDPTNNADPLGLQCVSGQGHCLETNRITAQAPASWPPAFHSLGFASGIYWFVAHRWGANDGSVSSLDQLYARDADGITTPADASQVAPQRERQYAVARSSCVRSMTGSSAIAGAATGRLTAAVLGGAVQAIAGARLGMMAGGIVGGATTGGIGAPVGAIIGGVAGYGIRFFQITGSLGTAGALVGATAGVVDAHIGCSMIGRKQ